MNKTLEKEWTLEFKEIAKVVSVQFTNWFIDVAKVRKSNFNKKYSLKDLKYAHVVWPDFPEDRKNVTIDVYDEKWITPAVKILVETITKDNPANTVYKFFTPETKPLFLSRMNDSLILESQNIIIFVSRSDMPNNPLAETHGHFRLDVFYTIIEPEVK
jgi:hypothetical protein